MVCCRSPERPGRDCVREVDPVQPPQSELADPQPFPIRTYGDAVGDGKMLDDRDWGDAGGRDIPDAACWLTDRATRIGEVEAALGVERDVVGSKTVRLGNDRLLLASVGAHSDYSAATFAVRRRDKDTAIRRERHSARHEIG